MRQQLAAPLRVRWKGSKAYVELHFLSGRQNLIEAIRSVFGSEFGSGEDGDALEVATDRESIWSFQIGRLFAPHMQIHQGKPIDIVITAFPHATYRYTMVQVVPRGYTGGYTVPAADEVLFARSLNKVQVRNAEDRPAIFPYDKYLEITVPAPLEPHQDQ